MISTHNIYKNKGFTLVSLLLTLSMFALLILSFQYWASLQWQKGTRLYQQKQALQIWHNAMQQQFLGIPCEREIQQNGINFIVDCNKGMWVRGSMDTFYFSP